mmetsp:Transcript_15346/g.35332  ORF Transcript_15346/g.35332 Transcript_15346/m.35332 type:complete len:97 (-) Transcript_15346:241-531(-)
MERKAKREGKPADAYLSMGRTPPTRNDVCALRKLAPQARMGWWAARFGQHCLALHADGHCERSSSAYGCAFLHVAALADEDTPTWLQEDLQARTCA